MNPLYILAGIGLAGIAAYVLLKSKHSKQPKQKKETVKAMATNTPEYPAIPSPTGNNQDQVLDAIKETVEMMLGRRGTSNTLKQLVTVNDLYTAGMANVQASDGSVLSYDDTAAPGAVLVARGEGQGVVGTPSAPTGLIATGTTVNMIIEWDQPDYSGHWRTEIWRSASNDLGTASKIGTSRTLLYFDALGTTNTTRYYWIRHVNIAGKAGPYNGGPNAGTQGITGLIQDSDINTISATKIVAAQLSSISANIGAVTAGTLSSADATMIIDLTSKQITISGPNGQSADDYMILTGGLMEFYKWTGASHVLYKAVKHIENGTANSGDIVTIPGYWDSQPKIIISPRNLESYSSTNSSQDQSLDLMASSIQEVTPGSGQWKFTATANLVLSASSGSNSPNYTSGALNVDTHTTPLYTTPANCTSITAHVRVTSKRGTGTAPNWYYRQVDSRLKYRAVGSGTWLYTSYVTTVIGAQFNSVTDSVVLSGLAADTYEFYVEYVASDAGGTFTSGTGGTEYSTEDLVASDISASAHASFSGPSPPQSGTANAAFPASSKNTSWEIYQVDYNYNYSWSHTSTGLANGYYYGASNGSVTSSVSFSYDHTNAFGTPGPSSGSGVGTHQVTGSSLTFDQTLPQADINISSITSSPSGDGDVTATVNATSLAARIYRRHAITNSATPENTFELQTWDYQLTSATTVATGTLNWMALGE